MSVVSLIFALTLAGCPVQEQVLSAAADRIEAEYMDPAEGAAIAANVRGWRDQGRYHAECGRDEVFAAQFQRDLAVYDAHFRVEATEAGPDADNWLTLWRASAVAANSGVREVRVMEGNIGYLRLSSFHSWDLAHPKLESALHLLTDVAGLILDLRQNGGGDGETAGHVLRALLPAESESVAWMETRHGRTEERLPDPVLPAVAAQTPIMVLIDRRTGSAAEAVAYALQSQGRAELVGIRSGGAAHMIGDPVSLPHGFSMGIPEARPIDRITGVNWEQTGVNPDVDGGDDPLFIARRMLMESRQD